MPTILTVFFTISTVFLSYVCSGAAIAAEEDKLHQQGGEFKMGHQYRNRNIGYQDPSEGSEATHPLVRTIDRGKTASMEKGGNILVDREVSQMPTFPSLVEVDVGSQIPSLGSGVIEDLSSFSKSSASCAGRSTTFNGTAFPSVAAPSNSSSGMLLSLLCFSYLYALVFTML